MAHAPPTPSTPTPTPPRFVTGSLMRHIVVMAGTGGIGLVAIPPHQRWLLPQLPPNLLGYHPTV